MSPTKRTARKPVRKTAHKPAKRAAPQVKRAPRKPAAPVKWSADIRDVNVVWYNVSDFARAKKFYGETLGLPVAFDVEEMGWAEFGYPNQTHLAVNLWRDHATMPPALGGATATLTCDDVRGAFDRLRAKGVRCDEIEEYPGSVILGAFYDPDGNRLQLAQTLAQ